MDNYTVLCVDDEVHILSALKRLLRKEGYTFLTAVGGAEALEILQKQKVHLVISDYRMPEMTGVELIQKIKVIAPDTIRVILSGYADVSVILDAINKSEVYRFLTKPWNDDELKVSIRQCLQQFDLVRENIALMKKIKIQNTELKVLNEDLERRVEERTRSLRLSQQVLAEFPIPIIGMSEAGMIALVNEAVVETYPSLKQLSLGQNIQEVLPPRMGEAVREILNAAGADGENNTTETLAHRKAVELRLEPLGQPKSHGEISERDKFLLDGKAVRLRLKLLGKPGEQKGAILLLEEASWIH